MGFSQKTEIYLEYLKSLWNIIKGFFSWVIPSNLLYYYLFLDPFGDRIAEDKISIIIWIFTIIIILVFLLYTPYVKSKVDKTGIISKIKVTKPILGEYSHAKYINSRAFISHICHS